MLKKILKQIFPIVLLKNCYLILNGIRRITFDSLLFPEYKILKSRFRIFKTGNQFINYRIDISGISDKEIRKKMSFWEEWEQEEFILELNEKCFIEPSAGWGIINGNRVIPYSLGLGNEPHVSKPPVIDFFFKRRKSLYLDRAISLRDTGEENYFHFYNDVLAKLFFLKNNGYKIEKIPIIISEKLYNKPYFDFFLIHSKLLADLNWVFQNGDTNIICGSIIFCKPITHRIDLFNNILSSIQPFQYGKVNAMEGKIFLTRKKNRLRFIENMDDIMPVFKEFGFEIVDADDLSMEQQIILFSNTRYLVGIHGAGLTNMIFRKGNPMSILEIFPYGNEKYLPFHYIMLAKMFEFKYDAMMGQRPDHLYSGGFSLSPSLLSENIRKLLN